MEPFPPHPGTILSIEESDSIVTTIQASEVPEKHRFVYLDAQDREVDSVEQAAKRIPIVEVRMLAVNQAGQIVPKAQSYKMYIREYGPGQQMLRSTTMVKH